MKSKIIKIPNISNWNGGLTKEYFIFPEGSSYKDRDFSFRISAATVDISDSPFTNLSGFNRALIPTSGDLELLKDGKIIKINKHDIFLFSGDESIKSINPGTDFNLMVRKDLDFLINLINVRGEIILSCDDDIKKAVFVFPVTGEVDIKYDGVTKTILSNELIIFEADKLSSIYINSNDEAKIIYGRIYLWVLKHMPRF